MSILAKLASIIGAMLFLGIVFIVSAAVIQYMESAHDKPDRHGPRRPFHGPVAR